MKHFNLTPNRNTFNNDKECGGPGINNQSKKDRYKYPVMGMVFFICTLFCWHLQGQEMPETTKWQWLNPSTSNYTLVAVHFNDIQHGWALSEAGLVLMTSDGGFSWNQARVDSTDGELYDLYFADNQNGWVVGESGYVAVSSDGGKTWTNQSAPSYEDFLAVEFADTDNGWIAGEDGEILTTHNGGNTWMEAKEGIGWDDLNGLDVLSPSMVYAASGSNGEVLFTSDTGSTWDTLSTGSTYANLDLIFIDPVTGWVVNSNGQVFHTTDSGKTWNGQDAGIEGEINAVHFLDDQTGFIAGESGKIFATSDGGQNWMEQESGQSEYEDLHDIYFSDNKKGYAVGAFSRNGLGGANMVTTLDGGEKWMPVSQATLGYTLQKTFFIDENTGWIAGQKYESVSSSFTRAFLSKTIDGGETWADMTPSNSDEYKDLFFVTGDAGWLIAKRNLPDGNDDGFEDGVVHTIYKTSDGGNNWTAQDSVKIDDQVFDENLQALYFLDEMTGWAVGENTILHTTDGGANWTEQTNGVGEAITLTDAYFMNADKGVVVGYDYVEDHAAVLHTTDGGESWNRELVDQERDRKFNAMHFTDDKNGWAVGTDGLYARTRDGGQSWNIMEHPYQNTLTDVFFKDTSMGWTTGSYPSRVDDCELWSTRDGGETWNCTHDALKRSFSNLFDMHFTADGSGYIVGSESLVLKASIGTGTNIAYRGNPFMGESDSRLKAYPNPFSHATTIRYRLRKDSRSAKIHIYNLTGKRLKTYTLNAGERNGQIQLQSVALPEQGVLLYKLMVDGRSVETRKLIILQ